MSIFRNRFLSIAFTLLLITYVDTKGVQYIIILLSCTYHYLHLKKYVTLLFIFFLFFQMTTTQVVIKPEGRSHIVRIDEIRTNYCIASNKDECYLLYNLQDVDLYDIVEVEGSFEEIKTTNNLGMFHFASYLKRKDIHYSMFVNRFTIKMNANHIKAKLYRYTNQFDDKTSSNIKTMLYRNYDETLEYKHLLFTSGVHISAIVQVIAFLTKKNRNWIACIFTFTLMMLLPMAPYLLRIFLFSLIPLLFTGFSSREHLGLSIIVTLLSASEMAYEVSFIIPICYRLLFLFDIQKVPRIIKQYLAIFPIQLIYFHEVNFLTLIAFPFLRYVQALSFTLLAATLLFPNAAILFNTIMEFQIFIISFLSKSLKIIGKPNIVWTILWCCSTYLLITYKQKKHYLYILLLLVYQANMKLLTPFGEVSFLDVSQGDCILIREPFNGKVVMIDVANQMNKDIAKTTIYPFLKAKGITSIDYVIITHDDYDHNGGLPSLKKQIQIKNIITDKEDIALSKTSIKALQSKTKKDKNDESLILFTKINNLKYLFMGDASRSVELEILEQYNKLKVDVLKVGHHGSHTSSDPYFIHQIQPKISVISSGRNNRYNHPSKSVVEILENNQSYIRNTQLHGSTSIYSILGMNIMISANNQIIFL